MGEGRACSGDKSRETNLPAEQIGAQAPAWVSRAHGDQGWPQGRRGAAGARPQAAECVIGTPAPSFPVERLKRRGDFRAAAADSLTISRNRRRTRLRSTASPTCFDTVNPIRTAPPSARRRACTTNALPEARRPAAAARKSLRRFSRSTGNEGAGAPITHSAACGRAPAAPRRPCGHPWSPCARETHAGAGAPICSAGRFVSRDLSPLHARPPPTCRSDRANTLCRTRTFNSAHAPRDWRGLYGSPHGSSMRRRAEPRSAPRPLFPSVICPPREMYGISMMGSAAFAPRRQ